MATLKGKSVAGFVGAWMIGALLAGWLGGCDLPPRAPVTGDGKPVKVVAVNIDDQAEVAAVTKLLDTAAKYKHALTILQAFFAKTGALDEQTWAKDELKNLAKAQTFTFEGVPAPLAPGSESLEGANEPALVERAISARQAWQESLAQLADHYRIQGLNFKLALVRCVQKRFDPIKVHSYYLHAEVPPATLKGTDVIPEAEALFAEAYKLHRRGKLIPLMPDYGKQRRALTLFRRVVSEHPTSTKIGPSAFYIAEIYKEYFNANLRAVAWYERAWQWEPELLLPARFQAAVTYDLRMGHYAKALALYREVLKHETFNITNVNFSINRIAKLTAKKK